MFLQDDKKYIYLYDGFMNIYIDLIFCAYNKPCEFVLSNF